MPSRWGNARARWSSSCATTATCCSPRRCCRCSRRARRTWKSMRWSTTTRVPMLEGHPALSQLYFVGRALARSAARCRALRAGKASLQRRCAARALRPARASYRAAARRLARAPARRALQRRAGDARPRRVLERRASRICIRSSRGGRRHQVELNLDALRRIGVQPGSRSASVQFVPGRGRPSARDRRQLVGDEFRFIHMHPASRWRFKCWPARAQRRADRPPRGRRPRRRAHRGARTRVGFIEEILRKHEAKPVNLAGKLSIKELGALTAQREALRRRRLDADAPRRGDGHADAWRCSDRAARTSGGPGTSSSASSRRTHTCRPCGNDGCGGGKVTECLTSLPVDAGARRGARAAREVKRAPSCASATTPTAGPSASSRARCRRSSARAPS